jgi:hypothetical protein
MGRIQWPYFKLQPDIESEELKKIAEHLIHNILGD